MLGPGALTTHLADLGADVIKVETPQGDYGRRMTWPIVEGVSLLFLHISRGKRSIVLDLRTEAGCDAFRELVRGRGRGGRGHAARADSTGAASAFEQLREVNPQIVFVTISGYGMTGPYRDMPSHGIAYDVWAGHRATETSTTTGFPYMPEHVSIGIHAGPLFGALGILAGVVRARETGEGCRARDRAVGRRRRDRLVAQRDVARVRTSGVRGHRQRSPTTTSGARRHRGHARTASATSSTRRQTATCSSWRPSSDFWKNFCAGVDRLDLFERWPGSQYGDHAAGQPRAAATSSRDIFATRTSAEWIDFGASTTHRSRRSNTPHDRCSTTRSSATGSR